ncbi:MAG: 16S rRNA (cytosine(1402)-N(4))-methyltransferase RsmH [Spirochaetales bacterium]|nr:16S rRNA (cytosine(1402)-N(4))-methyltransferase RsmH [Spirochaetales bacterium]
MEVAHVPVLLDECLELLAPPGPDALMVDLNLGEGGHAEAFLDRFPRLRYIGVDADASIQERARVRLARFGARVRYVRAFSDEALIQLKEEGVRPDVAFFDLGVSMFHFRDARRGFSFMQDEVLDMRLDPSTGRSASVLIAEATEDELAGLLAEYGEEPYARRVAAALVKARGEKPIDSSARLAELVRAAVPAPARHGRIHPATRTFQALRVAVNDELGRAGRAFALAAEILAPGGVLGIITFHSLEDGLAKRFMREAASGSTDAKALDGRARYLLRKGRRAADDAAPAGDGTVQAADSGRAGMLEPVGRKPVEPSAAEIARNPASRSAKLRVARKPAALSGGGAA